MAVFNPFDFFLEPDAENFPFALRSLAAAASSRPYLRDRSRPRRASRRIWPTIAARADATIDFLVGLNQRLQQDIGYVIRMEPGVQTPEQTLANARGLVPRHRAGCSCSCCATSAWRRASSPAI